MTDFRTTKKTSTTFGDGDRGLVISHDEMNGESLTTINATTADYDDRGCARTNTRTVLSGLTREDRLQLVAAILTVEDTLELARLVADDIGRKGGGQ